MGGGNGALQGVPIGVAVLELDEVADTKLVGSGPEMGCGRPRRAVAAPPDLLPLRRHDMRPAKPPGLSGRTGAEPPPPRRESGASERRGRRPPACGCPKHARKALASIPNASTTSGAVRSRSARSAVLTHDRSSPTALFPSALLVPRSAVAGLAQRVRPNMSRSDVENPSAASSQG